MSPRFTLTTPWASILCLIFVVLKLTDNVDWSWVWVLSPVWICLAIVFVGWVLGEALNKDDWKRLV